MPESARDKVLLLVSTVPQKFDCLFDTAGMVSGHVICDPHQ